MPVTIYTNMDWKATPNYNSANGTAGEPDESGIVKFENGKVAKTDEVEIVFSEDLPGLDKSDPNYQKVQNDVSALKNNGRLQTTADPNDPCALSSSDIWARTTQQKVVAADGSTFEVEYVYDRFAGKDYRTDYLGGLERKLTSNASSESTCQLFNIKADITSYFSTASSLDSDEYAIKRAYDKILKEISQNIANGKENPTEGLKTTVTVNGTEWNFAELLNTVEEINKGFEYFDTHVTLDYADYARLGASRAYVTDWASKNLSEDKQSVVADSINARVETYLLREKESLEASRELWDKGVPVTGDKAQYYDSNVLSASNKEVREAIMKLFEETDYDSPASVSNTVSRYKNTMLPIIIAFGGIQGAAESVDYSANNVYKFIAGLFGGKAVQGLNVSV